MICVYKIINIISNHIYIGSTIDFNKRKSTHLNLLKRNKHHSVRLQRSYNNDGLESFKFEVIEECNILNKQEREQFYIDTLIPEYNMSLSSKCPMLGRNHTEDTIVKFKLIQRPKGEECHRYGKSWSEETRQKILSSRIGTKRSDSFKLTQSENAKRLNLARFIKDSCKLKVIDDLGNIYESIKHAAISNGVSSQTVCDILKGRHKQTRKKRSFKYYEPT